jgi:ketosteroid isomerase-like protein
MSSPRSIALSARTPTTAEVVRRYYELVAGSDTTPDELQAVLHPDARLVEHPNPVVPQGAVRGVTETLQGFRAGKTLLSAQEFEIHEVLADGPRASVRGNWRGPLAQDAGPYLSGTVLEARIAAWLTVRDGQVVEHETFDCYLPFPTAPIEPARAAPDNPGPETVATPP